jgi:SAM-dependent methyltransferase
MLTTLKRWNIHSSISDTIYSIKTIGFLRTLAVIQNRLADVLFDLRYGTNTVQIEHLASLEIPSENVQRGQRYQPTGALAFKKIIQTLPHHAHDVFVDYGCGKARTLLLASIHGFTKVRGIEFSPDLCQSAEENIRIFREHKSTNTDFEVLCTDAARYVMRHDETFLYFFHPFDDTIMSEVMKNISASAKIRPRPIFLIYYLPRHNNIIDSFPEFTKIHSLLAYGYQCIIYQFTPPAQPS